MRFSLSVVAACLSIGSARALDWTSSQGKPAFAVAGGDKIRGVNLGGWVSSLPGPSCMCSAMQRERGRCERGRGRVETERV